jgi:hypothetical protein
LHQRKLRAVRTLTLLIRDPLPNDWRVRASSVPALEFVLRRGHATAAPCSGSIAWLCQRFGLTPSGNCPLAPILAQSAHLGLEHSQWLCADPIHVDVHPQQVSVARGADLELTTDESLWMVQALDRHFASRGVRVAPFDPTRWLINAPALTRLDTAPPDSEDRLLRVMVSGEDTGRWNAFLTEVQMLLHDHPVNAARASRGALPVNSLYLWGAGIVASTRAVDTLAASDDPLTLALIRTAHLELHRDVPAALDRASGMPAASVLAVPASGERARAHQDTIRAVDQHWLAPALQMLEDRRLDRLELVVREDASAMKTYTVARRAFWQLWKRTKLISRLEQA